MSFSGAAFKSIEKDFTVTARAASDSTQRTVSIKDRLGLGGGGGGGGPSVSFGASPTSQPRLMSDRLGGGGGPPRGGNRYSNHDDRTMPYNDYDRSDRGSYRGGNRGRGNGGYQNDHWRGGNRGGGGGGGGGGGAYRGGNRGRGGNNRGNNAYRTDNRNYRGNPRGGNRGNQHDNRGYAGLRKDGDVAMSNLDADSRGRPTQHRAGQDRPKTYGPTALTRWHKIRLRNTKDKGYDRAGLLQFFTQELDMPFHAINFVQEETSILFWVQGDEIADSFKAIHNRAMLPDGERVSIHVLADHQSPPMADVGDPVVVDALKNVLNTRYTLENCALDLSEFDKNEVLRSQGFYVPLTKIPTLEALAKVIKGAGVQLKALSLKNNNLGHLTDIANIFGGCPSFNNLEILHLGENLLKFFTDLDKIRSWPLQELFLEGNPIKEYEKRDREVLSTAVRKRFPKLRRLDDEDLPVEIGFEVESEEEKKELPPTQKFGSSSPEALELIKTFLQHYFEIYDRNKQELLPAYHPDSVFSISAVYNKSITHKQPDLTAYMKNKGVRNLRFSVWSEEQPGVKTEPLNIVAYLNNLPKTEHDPNSLTIDTGFVSPALLTFVVTGLFREIPSSSSASSSSASSASSPIRSFSRSFVTIPVGAGMQIINDQLTITNATDAQIRDAFTQPTPAPVPVVAPVVNPVVVPLVVPTDVPALTPEQQALIVEFMKQTNLIEKFALDALQSAGWNLDEARNLFQQHKDKIPPQGFRPL